MKFICDQMLAKLGKWLLAPFSRCLICNSLLLKVDSSSQLELPLNIIEQHEFIWHCPTCNKLFWLGSHTEHMLKELQRWNQG